MSLMALGLPTDCPFLLYSSTPMHWVENWILFVSEIGLSMWPPFHQLKELSVKFWGPHVRFGLRSRDWHFATSISRSRNVDSKWLLKGTVATAEYDKCPVSNGIYRREGSPAIWQSTVRSFFLRGDDWRISIVTECQNSKKSDSTSGFCWLCSL